MIKVSKTTKRRRRRRKTMSLKTMENMIRLHKIKFLVKRPMKKAEYLAARIITKCIK